MKNLKICSCILVALLISSTAFSQDSTKTFTISGSVDTYFHSSFGTQNFFPFDADEGPSGSYGPSSSF
ncbi:MAG TPA: hypothetical protein VE467_13210, partial [Chryseolinea sp.]|nr:hypothetical protein [Chryseolinea sp.]